MKNKSNRKLAKELLKLIKSNNQYNPFDYWYKTNEFIEVATENQIIGALCSCLTKKWLKEMRHKETEIRILGVYDASLYIINDALGVEIPLIHLGRLLEADEPAWNSALTKVLPRVNIKVTNDYNNYRLSK
jgi:hypothetical protein